MKICGIYKITNMVNSKCYIGQSVNCIRRLNIHKWELEKNKHFNVYLQKAWNKYNKDNFKFEVIFLCNRQDLDNHEIFFIDYFNSYGKQGYNQCEGGKTNYGFEHTEETRLKIAKSKIGKPRSLETRKRLSEINIGKIVSQETRQKISKGSKGKKRKQFFGVDNSFFGRKHTIETLKKMSDAHRGCKSWNKGQTTSDEVKKKISNTKTGVKHRKPEGKD